MKQWNDKFKIDFRGKLERFDEWFTKRIHLEWDTLRGKRKSKLIQFVQICVLIFWMSAIIGATSFLIKDKEGVFVAILIWSPLLIYVLIKIEQAFNKIKLQKNKRKHKNDLPVFAKTYAHPEASLEAEQASWMLKETVMTSLDEIHRWKWGVGQRGIKELFPETKKWILEEEKYPNAELTQKTLESGSQFLLFGESVKLIFTFDGNDKLFSVSLVFVDSSVLRAYRWASVFKHLKGIFDNALSVVESTEWFCKYEKKEDFLELGFEEESGLLLLQFVSKEIQST
ncbi:MAG: hypothetical protein KAI72_01795 [Candidatus Pacebacteria bacterium]|nr:hypothetical protein [Candidatus Paceibacterota bacterium]